MPEREPSGREGTSAAADAAALRRLHAIVFSDLSESTRIAGGMEAEDYGVLVGKLRQIFKDAIQHHGGEVVQNNGDSVFAIFSYGAYEDAGRRATGAAIAMGEGARLLETDEAAQGFALRLHTGIHVGAFPLLVGDPTAGAYNINSVEANVAKRLADLAKAEEIIVSEATLGADRHFFRTSEVRAVQLRGKDEPIDVLSVHGRQPMENRFAARQRRGVAPFIGRDAELAQLQACLDQCLAGQSQLAALVGAPGLGKTRLANEFLALAADRGLQIHRGYCESYLGARPLQPFLQILASILQVDPALADAEASAALPGGAAEGAAQTASLATQSAEVLGKLIAREAETGPIALFIDDWQWADDASRQVLDALRGIADRPIFILLATRGYDAGDASMSSVKGIHLAPLSFEEAKATIEVLLVAPPSLVTQIADYAGGNPLYIEELCHARPHGGEQAPLGGGMASLDAIIEARFSRLPTDQAKLVKTASVIGHMIPPSLFEEITGVSQYDPAIDDLAGQDFIYRDEGFGTLRFKHGITRDAVYRIVGLSERRSLHLEVVDALHELAAGGSEEEHLEALAYHYGAGGNRANAALYAERAGDKAKDASALDRAQAQYQAALVALGGLDPTDDLIRRENALVSKFGYACVVDPSSEQLPILQRAAARAAARADIVALAWAEFWLGYIHYGLGECRKAIAHCESALQAAAKTGDDKLVVQIRATLGQALAAACDYTPALALLDEAIEIKRQHRSGARQSIGLAYSLSCKALVLADRGQFEEAYAGFDEAIGTLGGAVHETAASVICHRAGAYLWQGRMQDAADYALESGRIAERVKARYLVSMARAVAAYARWSSDRSPEALRTIIEATSWLEASQSQQFLSLNFGWLAEAMVVCGDVKAARSYAARALLRGRKGDRLGEAMALRALASAAAHGENRHAPGHYLERAIACAQARQSAHEAAKNQLCAAQIALAAGDGMGARPLLAEAHAAFDAMQMPWFTAQADTTRTGLAFEPSLTA